MSEAWQALHSSICARHRRFKSQLLLPHLAVPMMHFVNRKGQNCTAYLIFSGDSLQEAEVVTAVEFEEVLFLSRYRSEALQVSQNCMLVGSDLCQAACKFNAKAVWCRLSQ